MATLNSAGIHCNVCSCIRTYSGSTFVGDEKCDVCDHELRAHRVDAQVFVSQRLAPCHLTCRSALTLNKATSDLMMSF